MAAIAFIKVKIHLPLFGGIKPRKSIKGLKNQGIKYIADLRMEIVSNNAPSRRRILWITPRFREISEIILRYSVNFAEKGEENRLFQVEKGPTEI